MNQTFHAYCLEDTLYGKTHAARITRLAERAMGEIADFVKTYCVVLSLSFGKDSMTLLHLASNAGVLPQIPLVMFNHSGLETPDTEAFRDYVVERYALTQFQETRPDHDTLVQTLAQIDRAQRLPMKAFVYQCLEVPRWNLMDAYHITGAILGLRAEESRIRRMNYAMRGGVYYNRREENVILTPVVKWTWQEVYGYAANEQIPLHPIYRKKQKYQPKRQLIRHNTPLSIDFFQDGDMLLLKQMYPETFAQYERLYPNIRQFL